MRAIDQSVNTAVFVGTCPSRDALTKEYVDQWLHLSK